MHSKNMYIKKLKRLITERVDNKHQLCQCDASTTSSINQPSSKQAIGTCDCTQGNSTVSDDHAWTQ